MRFLGIHSMRTAEQILSDLSLEEKIRLLNGNGNWSTFSARGKIPALCMSDGPHGLRYQGRNESYSNINKSRKATCFPTASAIACGWNVSAVEKMARAIAREAKSRNVNIILGCGMNIKRSPLCGRNFEYFSEDPLLTGELAAAYVSGMQAENVGACIKHFALNNQEKFRQVSSSNADERTMREIYLAGFERAVKKSAPVSVMSSYNRINGIYASASRALLTQTLRTEWGFKGIVISDWGATIDAAESLRAGMDLGMPDSHGYFLRQIKAALRSGTVSEKDIDAACIRIIRLTLRLSTENHAPQENPVDYEAQHESAHELALESAVLLKNDGMLPLRKETGGRRQKIIVVGELAERMRFQGTGSSHINTEDYPSALDFLRDDFDVVYVRGYVSSFRRKNKKEREERRLRSEAAKKISAAVKENPAIPVLYFCGLEESCEGEGFDRTDLRLPEGQTALYRELRGITDNVALVTFSGSPVDLTFAENARAILHMHLCGEACGKACHELITGIKNPSGKLAETWPIKAETGIPVSGRDVNYSEGTLVGYRWYETKNIPVQFEFGFGLSYSRFEYSDMRVEEISGEDMKARALFRVSLAVTNAGGADGSETVQLYVKNPPPPEPFTRAATELRAFEKVFLRAGQRKTLTFTLTERDFSVYSVKKKSFTVIGGEYGLCAAASVKDIRLTASVSVRGERLCDTVLTDEEAQEHFPAPGAAHAGERFTLTDNLDSMAQESLFVRALLKVFEMVLVLSSRHKSREDPAVKISLSAIRENPVESFISTAGGMFTERFARLIVKCANRKIRA